MSVFGRCVVYYLTMTRAVYNVGGQQTTPSSKLEKLPRPIFTLNMTETRPLHPSPPDHFVRNCKNRKNFLLNMLCNEITLHVYFWEYIHMFCGPVLLWTLEIQVHGGATYKLNADGAPMSIQILYSSLKGFIISFGFGALLHQQQLNGTF